MSAAPGKTSEDATKAIADAHRFKMSEASIRNLMAALNRSSPSPSGGDGVWPEHVEIVQAFLAVSMQWRVVSRGGGGAAGPLGGMMAPIVPMFVGLDYSAVRAGLDAEGIAVTPELWRGLRVMEDEACLALNESS